MVIIKEKNKVIKLFRSKKHELRPKEINGHRSDDKEYNSEGWICY